MSTSNFGWVLQIWLWIQIKKTFEKIKMRTNSKECLTKVNIDGDMEWSLGSDDATESPNGKEDLAKNRKQEEQGRAPRKT